MSKKYLSSELASEMEKVLIKKANNVDDSNLENAVNYLNSAIDILEDAGLSSKANKVLKVLQKLAYSEDELLPYEDNSLEEKIKLARLGNKDAIVEITTLLSREGYSQETIKEILKPEISESIVEDISDEPVSEIDTMITEASRKRPRNPEKVSDRHTKNLNPKRMVKNLKGHGTVFNMADISYSNDDLLDLDIDVEDPDFTSSDSDLTFED